MSKTAQLTCFDKKTSLRSTKGFTLVELIIVVSIIAIMTSAIVPSFSNYTKGQVVKQAQEQVVNDLANVQNRALAGNQGTPLNAKYWGIVFSRDSGTYNYVSSTNSTCGGAIVERIVKLPENVVIHLSGADLTRCVAFSLANGDRADTAIAETTIHVKKSGDSTCREIAINSAGLIRKTSVTTCP